MKEIKNIQERNIYPSRPQARETLEYKNKTIVEKIQSFFGNRRAMRKQIKRYNKSVCIF